MLAEAFENRDPSARWTFFDPASPRFAAKTKLALKRSNSRLCGRYAAGAGDPEKSPMRALRDPIFQLRKGPLSFIRS
jgi:hypothetical protein